MLRNPNNNNPLIMIARLMTGFFASTVMAIVLIAVLYLMPRPWPKVTGEMKPFEGVVQGVHETNYWIGTLKERYTVRDGAANGPAWHFYPNGSLLREMTYKRGAVQGHVREYTEAPRRSRRRPGPVLERGRVKAEWTYRNGRLDGPYVVYGSKGRPPKAGSYVDGARVPEEK